MTPGGGEARRVAERAARESYGLLLALLCAEGADLAAAEDALADAFVAALSQWPLQGVPASPVAWLLTVARRKRVDALRRLRTGVDGEPQLMLLMEELQTAAGNPGDIPDRRLALMFACAHPGIESSIRAPLMLQTILGLSAAEIAPAFLVPPATMGQRLVRAKARIAKLAVPLTIPDRDEIAARLDGVLEAVYAAYFRGWEDCGGTGTPALVEEAIWLCRVVISLLGDESEAVGLLALMLYAEARRPARRNAAGVYVPLDEQDAAGWNLAMIDEAETLLMRASREGATGRYQVEAAIQSAHVARRLHGVSNRFEVASLYDVLFSLVPSPVVALNRSVARAEIDGPAAALAALDGLAADRRLKDYQPYWAARGQLCLDAVRREEARQALEIAVGLTSDPAVRAHLQAKFEGLAEVRAS